MGKELKESEIGGVAAWDFFFSFLKTFIIVLYTGNGRQNRSN